MKFKYRIYMQKVTCKNLWEYNYGVRMWADRQANRKHKHFSMLLQSANKNAKTIPFHIDCNKYFKH